MNRKEIRLLVLLAAIGTAAIIVLAMTAESQPRPNLVVIVADDLGFSDFGPYGSEIPTPAISSLVANGLQFTGFRTDPWCPLHRAVQQTGQAPHSVGVPALGGVLSTLVPTVAELLSAAGYETFAVGKRQVIGTGATYTSGAYGFGHTYSCAVEGGGFYFWPSIGSRPTTTVERDGVVQQTFPPGWFSSDEIEREAVAFLAGRTPAAPFFLYMPLQDPHYPLQARQSEIDAVSALYPPGWNWQHARLGRWGRQKQRGMWPGFNAAPGRDPAITKKHADMTAAERADVALRATVYAAQVQRVDRAVGAVVAELERQDVLGNTLVIVTSDNGGNHRWSPLGTTWQAGAGVGSSTFFGTPGGNIASVSNTPFVGGKVTQADGGQRVPCVVRFDGRIPTALAGSLQTGEWNVLDIAPTLLALGGVSVALPGSSMLPALSGTAATRPGPQFFEAVGDRAAVWFGWKLRQVDATLARLYHLPTDPGETMDWMGASPWHDWLASELAHRWLAWALANSVPLP